MLDKDFDAFIGDSTTNPGESECGVVPLIDVGIDQAEDIFKSCVDVGTSTYA